MDCTRQFGSFGGVRGSENRPNRPAGRRLTLSPSYETTALPEHAAAGPEPGGLTFPTVLLASTPNDGAATVRLSSVATTQGRLKIQALSNVFFAVNNANITLTGPPLPVELAAFSAEAHGPVAHLAWTTASKKNNSGFAVEASADGREFQRLGWVPGQGILVTKWFAKKEVGCGACPRPSLNGHG